MNSEKRKAQIRQQNERAHIKKLQTPINQRDIDIICLIFEEKSSEEIGIILGLSKRTIDMHRRYILKKIGCRDVVGVIKYALRKGIVSL